MVNLRSRRVLCKGMGWERRGRKAVTPPAPRRGLSRQDGLYFPFSSFDSSQKPAVVTTFAATSLPKAVYHLL